MPGRSSRGKPNMSALIRQSGEHLLHLINEILDLARIDAGRLDLHEEVIEPSELVGSAIALVKDRAAAGLLKLAVDVEEDMPPLMADRTRLTEILLNLLSNAIKFTELGGAIEVLVRRTEEGGAAFVVRDNGRGMTEDEIEIALERFGQVDGGLARRHEGSGLGLPLARKLAELHGGSLTLKSEKGRGTTATVILPPSRVVSAKPSAVGPRNDPPSSGKFVPNTHWVLVWRTISGPGSKRGRGCLLTSAVRRHGAGRASNHLAQKPIAMAIWNAQGQTLPTA